MSLTDTPPPNSPLHHRGAAPAVCRAGYFQFAGHHRFSNTSVQSRALFWCKSGKGKFVLNGVTYPLSPGDLYLLPWNRSITYLPDSLDPMFTGHVHIVPWYRPDAQWVCKVPHESHEIAYDSPDRSDADWPGIETPHLLSIKTDEPVGLLIDYTIRRYLAAQTLCEREARHIAQLLITEIYRITDSHFSPQGSIPEELQRIISHVNVSFRESPSVTDLAQIISRSRSHVLKLFKKHMSISAKGYIIDRQLQEARELLLSTTKPISEIANDVGIPDPYHFSRLFRKNVGLSPRNFRQRHGPFASPPKASTHEPALEDGI